MTAPVPKTRRRAASPEQRREQLIKATIKCIARKGLSKTTMADVTKTARLSLGIVNLHFQSKDKLLVETLRYIADEYKQGWDAIVNDETLAPAEKIRALVDFDFSPEIANPAKLSVWFAFWGESRSRPKYMKVCGANDKAFSEQILAQCQALEAQTMARLGADTAALSIEGMIDGLWQNFLIGPPGFKRGQAIQAVYELVDALYPEARPE